MCVTFCRLARRDFVLAFILRFFTAVGLELHCSRSFGFEFRPRLGLEGLGKNLRSVSREKYFQIESPLQQGSLSLGNPANLATCASSSGSPAVCIKCIYFILMCRKVGAG